MRGKAQLLYKFTPALRITPAYAGKRVMDNAYLDYY